MRRSALLAVTGILLAAGVAVAACGSRGSNGATPSADAAATDATGDAAPGSEAGADGGAVQCMDFNRDKNVYWGDLHTHTALSADAYGWGNRNFPHDAYRFASDPSAQTPMEAPSTRRTRTSTRRSARPIAAIRGWAPTRSSQAPPR
jgi:hypothetical protein